MPRKRQSSMANLPSKSKKAKTHPKHSYNLRNTSRRRQASPADEKSHQIAPAAMETKQEAEESPSQNLSQDNTTANPGTSMEEPDTTKQVNLEEPQADSTTKSPDKNDRKFDYHQSVNAQFAMPIFIAPGSSTSNKPNLLLSKGSLWYSKATSRPPPSDRYRPEITDFWAKSADFWKPTNDEDANDRWFDPKFDLNQQFFKRYYHKRLFQTISSFTNCMHDYPWTSLSTDTQNKIKTWARNAEEHMQSVGQERDLLKQAWVFRIIYDNLFSPDCTEKWVNAWSSYGKLRHELQKHVTQSDNCLPQSFHNWRFHTTHMLYTLHGLQSDPVRLKRILMHELKDAINPSYSIEEIGEDLDPMVTTALWVDLLFEAFKAQITIDFCDLDTGRAFGFAYRKDSELMGMTGKGLGPYDEDKFTIDFVSRPLFRFYGIKGDPTWPEISQNEHGFTWYDRFDEFVPMEVVVSNMPDVSGDEDATTDGK